MGHMFRSEKMALCQLFIQPEAAYSIISELGEHGIVQFKDSNGEMNAFQRKFVNEVRRCNEIERKLRYIEDELKKENIKIPDAHVTPKAPLPREITDVETRVEKIDSEVRELSQNDINLKSDYLQVCEIKEVYEKSKSFFDNQSDEIDSRTLLTEDGAQSRGQLGFVAGVIARERIPGFERMLWRVCRGNIFLRRVDIEQPFKDPTTGHEILKTVFVAFYQGEQLKSRIKKVCAGYRATVHDCPTDAKERENALKNLSTRIEDLKLVLNQSQDHRQRVLFGASKDLHQWMIMTKKMKAVYHVLNMFNIDVSGKVMIGECWVPVGELNTVQTIFNESFNASGSTIRSFINVLQSNEMPPTYNKSNKFTRGFQNLIDSYGMGSYREVNPALYTIITFPFLFAVMFGDFGHAIILLLFGAYLCIWEKKIMAKKTDNEVFNIFFAGRYIILLMGLFALYTGAIYNDLFSRSVNIFGTSWDVQNSTTPQIPFDFKHYFKDNNSFGEETALDPAYQYHNTPYVFGIDPIWQVAKNKIIFLNSYKMKLSIIFGVIHMIFGVCMSVPNHIHFKKKVSIILEFVPMLLFLVCLFFYMVFMIFFKWVAYSAQDADGNPVLRGPTSPHCAPSVLILFINMMLFNKHTEPDKSYHCEEYFFEGQNLLQTILLVVALCCIPVLLLGKPIHHMCTRKKSKRLVTESNGDLNHDIELQPAERDMLRQAQPSGSEHEGGEEEEEEPISEVFIHQGIHTIEYILSTISHTASYLRLWALSLAHAQLSEVLWSMVMKNGFPEMDYVGGVMLFFVFGAWAVLTVSILVMMEGLSAFLHTLRLHWVEFMSKFFEGLGYAFQPYSFQAILDGTDENEGESS